MKTQVLETQHTALYGDETQFLKRRQLMELLDVSKWWTEQALLGDDPIPHIKRGQTLRFPKQACLRWFAASDSA